MTEPSTVNFINLVYSYNEHNNVIICYVTVSSNWKTGRRDRSRSLPASDTACQRSRGCAESPLHSKFWITRKSSTNRCRVPSRPLCLSDKPLLGQVRLPGPRAQISEGLLRFEFSRRHSKYSLFHSVKLLFTQKKVQSFFDHKVSLQEHSSFS